MTNEGRTTGNGDAENRERHAAQTGIYGKALGRMMQSEETGSEGMKESKKETSESRNRPAPVRQVDERRAGEKRSETSFFGSDIRSAIRRKIQESASDGVEEIAESLREVMDRLRSNNQDTAARFVEIVADRTSDFSEYIRQTDPTSVLSDVKDAAKMQPGLLIAGALAAGLLVARIIRNSDSGAGEARAENYQAFRSESIREEPRMFESGSTEEIQYFSHREDVG